MAPGLGSRLAFYLFFKPIRLKKPWDADLIDSSVERLSGPQGEVNLRIFGDRSQKQIILIHGWSSGGVVFQKLIRSLLSNGYCCLVPDMPAHATSPGKTTNVFEFKYVIDQIRQSFPDAHDLVGHSIGGVSSTLSVLDNPSGIAHLITVSSPVYLDQILETFFNTTGGGTRIMARMRRLLEQKFGKREDEVSIGKQVHRLDKDVKFLVIHDKTDAEVPYQESLELAENGHAKHFTSDGFGHTRLLKTDAVQDQIISFLTN